MVNVCSFNDNLTTDIDSWLLRLNAELSNSEFLRFDVVVNESSVYTNLYLHVCKSTT